MRVFDLTKGDIVVLNPLQTRYQMFSQRIFIPLYAAANEGIYRMNRGKRLLSFGKVLIASVGIILLSLLVIFGIFLLYFSLISSISLFTLIPISIGLLIVAGGIYGIIKLARFAKGVKINYVEGELIVPWSQVKNIVVVNVRQENIANRPSLVADIINPVYKEIGDWYIMRTDGSEIIIPNVDDPFNKLNYVKVKFSLTF
ncbi:conjugative plasmid protein (pARN3) [Sulfolobus sp. S-194]|uniref:conjugative plasmid protein (pARN3) n=1 Tax=Sulfolobus sp. S-194 TaxID=2512240 RepID=UPI0014371D9A|nr:conjugative plasmid protein (pARN3) [Sulfolobus sp. S-194]QIW22810.1 conjugative plasmid protein (pARN3) [Sulfolobus sp. S-194]